MTMGEAGGGATPAVSRATSATRGRGIDSPLEPSEGRNSAKNLISGFQPPGTRERIYFCCVHFGREGNLLRQLLETKHTALTLYMKQSGYMNHKNGTPREVLF